MDDFLPVKGEAKVVEVDDFNYAKNVVMREVFAIFK